MRDKLRTAEGKALYGRRNYTVEPVFGILKAAMGFRGAVYVVKRKSAANGRWSAWPTTSDASTGWWEVRGTERVARNRGPWSLTIIKSRQWGEGSGKSPPRSGSGSTVWSPNLQQTLR